MKTLERKLLKALFFVKSFKRKVLMHQEKIKTPIFIQALKRKTKIYDPCEDFEKVNRNATENSENFSPHKSY